MEAGEKHVVEVELEGMGGGGAITLEVISLHSYDMKACRQICFIVGSMVNVCGRY